MKQHLIKFLRSDLTERAGKTFVQAFLAVWIVSGFSLNQVALSAAAAAGLSALHNYVKTLRESDVEAAL